MNEDKLMDWITMNTHNIESNRNNLDLSYDDAKDKYYYCQGALAVLKMLLDEIKKGKFNEYIRIRESKVELNKKRLLSYFIIKNKDINNKIDISPDKFVTTGYINQLHLINEIICDLGLREE